MWKTNPETDITVFSTSFLLIVLYALLFAAEKWKKLDDMKFSRFLTLLFSMEVALMAMIGILENGFTDVEGKFTGNQNLKKAKAWLKEEMNEDLYRTELSINSYMDEAIYHNLNCISLFRSTVKADMISTFKKLGFFTDVNRYYHHGATQFTDSIFGVRYLIKNGSYNEDNFETHYEVLKQNQLSVKQLAANVVECISEDEDGGLYFTSIPYDEGFEITVDGEKQDAKILANAFLGFELEPLKEGQKEHKIAGTLSLRSARSGTTPQ